MTAVVMGDVNDVSTMARAQRKLLMCATACPIVSSCSQTLIEIQRWMQFVGLGKLAKVAKSPSSPSGDFLGEQLDGKLGYTMETCFVFAHRPVLLQRLFIGWALSFPPRGARRLRRYLRSQTHSLLFCRFCAAQWRFFGRDRIHDNPLHV